jgi:hypothetical protein
MENVRWWILHNQKRKGEESQEWNQINMVQGINRVLDGETIWSRIIITIVAKREIKALKLSSSPNDKITQRNQGLNDPPPSSTNRIYFTWWPHHQLEI